jgi:hypothetical protein
VSDGLEQGGKVTRNAGAHYNNNDVNSTQAKCAFP